MLTHTIPTSYAETGISSFLILYFIRDPYIIARKIGDAKLKSIQNNEYI